MTTKNIENTFDKNLIDPKYLDLGLLLESFGSVDFCREATVWAALGRIDKEEYARILSEEAIAELNRSADIRKRLGFPPFNLLRFTNTLLGFRDFQTVDHSIVN